MSRLLMTILFTLLIAGPAAAEKLCTRVGPSGDMLCVVNGENGPNWYVFTGCEDILTIDAPVTGKRVDLLAASASGRHLAIVSSDAEGSAFGIYSAQKLDYGEAPELEKEMELHLSDPAGLRWNREVLFFEVEDGQDAKQVRYQYDPKQDELTQLP